MTKIRDGIYGLCVADALGVPAECRTREDLRQHPVTGMSDGGIRGQNVGFWSDDSSMTLCLAKSIAQVGYFHTHDIMERFRQWFEKGAYTPGGTCFDFGHTCAKAIHRYQRGVTPALCGGNKMEENGNGSLMRILPVAFVLYGKYGKDVAGSSRAMQEIHRISGLTHRHPLAQSACGIYISIACHILDGETIPMAVYNGVEKALEWYGRHSRFLPIVDTWKNLAFVAQQDEASIRSGGYVVETLETALWCLLRTGNYRDCVLKCVNMGYDTDSTAAVAGGLAGLYYGYDGIPREWGSLLAGKEIIEDCVQGLERYCAEHHLMPEAPPHNLDDIRRADRWSHWNTALDQKATVKNRDKFLGCLIGGAAGDALGYAVEFLTENEIFSRYGKEGITKYRLQDGLARISDDTQMTLFTANGLLVGQTRGCLRGIMAPYPDYIAQAYQEWYITQVCDFPAAEDFHTCWLLHVSSLYARRAPGNTCVEAVAAGAGGSIERPINHSKGCGGVMRIAPVGLYLGSSRMAGLAADLVAADAAALTHGHELGYIPAAMLSHMVRLLSHSTEFSLEAAVQDSMEAVRRIFPRAVHLPAFLEKIQLALQLAKTSGSNLDAIHALGEGWHGDEALAIAVFCAVKYQDDFDKALLAAVNHSGDSDSTGAITGNLLGAYLGLSHIPEKYTDHLELLDVITEIAEDLYCDCQINEYTCSEDPRDVAWEKKYVEITYGGKDPDEGAGSSV